MRKLYETDLLRFTARFRDYNHNLADPDAITFVYRVEEAFVGTAMFGSSAMVHDSLGVYHIDIDSTGHPGRWEAEYFGSGNVQTAKRIAFFVHKSIMP